LTASGVTLQVGGTTVALARRRGRYRIPTARRSGLSARQINFIAGI
jgi:hypothetical protein